MVQPLPQRADLILPYGGKIVIAQQATGFHTVVLIAIHTLLTQMQPIMGAIPQRLRSRMVLAWVFHYDAPRLVIPV